MTKLELVDSKTLNSNLSSLADIIRKKGKDEKLIFPEDFIENIKNIEADPQKTIIGDYAFDGLSSFTLGQNSHITNISKIGKFAFRGTHQYPFSSSSSTSWCTFSNLEELGESAFSGVSYLRYLAFDKTCLFTKLPDNLLSGTSSTTVLDIWNSLDTTGDYIFANAKNKSVVLILRQEDKVCKLGEGVFSNISNFYNYIESALYYGIFVPESMIDAYKTDPSWSKYAKDDCILSVESLTEDGTATGNLSSTVKSQWGIK